MKIPSYNYKFKQIFKKICQTKALELSYVFPRIFTLLLFLLEWWKWKANTSLSDYGNVGLLDCRTNELLDYSYTPIKIELPLRMSQIRKQKTFTGMHRTMK